MSSFLSQPNFLYGYDTKTTKQKKLTLNNFINLPELSYIDPEFRRRLLGLFIYTVNSGKLAGIGGAYRSSDQQIAAFKSRYNRLAANKVPLYEDRSRINKKKPGTYRGPWDGSYWQLKRGFSPIATPGSSYHEPTTPDGRCLSVDLVGDTSFMGPIASNFGITWFGDSSQGEPWHFQPSDIPTARSGSKGYSSQTHHPLIKFDYSIYLDSDLMSLVEDISALML